MNRRSLFTIAGLVGATLLLHADYRKWRVAMLRRLGAGGRVLATASGTVECDCSGEGPAVLVAHGMSGGYDQARLVSHALGLEGSFRLLLPSRPGYLRTPLASGRSPAEQSDLYAALLDELDVDRAALIGFSGGGPSVLQFALRHPERCSALVLLSALTHPFERDRSSFMQRVLGMLIMWVRRAPISTWLVSRLLVLSRFSIAGNDGRGRAITNGLWNSILPGSARLPGVRNDDAQWDAMEVYDLAGIRAPTLVIHGDADKTVRPEMGRFAADTIPNARFMSVAGGTHLMVFRRRLEVGQPVRQFLRDHA